MEKIIGIVLLLTLVLGRFAYSQWRMRKLKARWEEANHAINAGDFDEAEAPLRACIKMMPIWLPAHRLLAVVLYRQGHMAQAEQAFRFAADLEPRNPQGHLELGYFYATADRSRLEDALSAFEEAVSHDPKVREVLRQDKRLDWLQGEARFNALIAEESGT